VHDGPESRLALDNGIRDTHLPTQRRQEDNQLDGIHIIGNQHQARLLVLNQPDHMVQSVFDRIRLLADILLPLALRHSSSLLVQPLLLLRLGLRSVLAEQLERLRRGVPVEDVLELGDGGRDFEAEVEDLLLALEANVFGPSHHTREVAARLYVLPDAEVARPFLDQRVLHSAIAHQRCQPVKTREKGRGMYLCGFLRGSRLALRERRRRGFLSLFGRLSLRKEDHQRIVFTNYASLNSRETARLLFSELCGSSHCRHRA